MDGGNDAPGGPRLVETGDWAGWRTWSGLDPFEDQSGPFYFREDDAGLVTTAFRAETKHMNGGGFMHGGALMTFADYCLFVIARDALADSRSVTATFNSEFVGAVPEGALLECTGDVVKAGRSMVFVRGLMTVEGEAVLSFSAVLKKTAPRAT